MRLEQRFAVVFFLELISGISHSWIAFQWHFSTAVSSTDYMLWLGQAACAAMRAGRGGAKNVAEAEQVLERLSHDFRRCTRLLVSVAVQ